MQYSRFWTTYDPAKGESGTGDQTTGYGEADWKALLSGIFGEGVAPGVDGGLAVSVTGSGTMSVAAGAAIDAGYFFRNDAAYTINWTAAGDNKLPTVGDTGFIVVLRAIPSAHEVRIGYTLSQDGNASIPAPVRNQGGTWETVLAQGTVAVSGAITLTDARTYLNPNVGPGAIVSSMLAANAVRAVNILDGEVHDVKLGTRTTTDTGTQPTSDTLDLTGIFQGIAWVLQAITGRNDWKLAPNRNMESLRQSFFATGHNHSGVDPNGPKIGTNGLQQGSVTAAILDVTRPRLLFNSLGSNVDVPFYIQENPPGPASAGAVWIELRRGSNGLIHVYADGQWN